MKHKIIYSNQVYDKNYQEIVDSLNSYYITDLKEPNENIRRGFGVYAKDENNNLVGGLVGYSELGWMYLDSLYVFERHRNMGLAKKFLEKAQDEAARRNCIGIKLECFKDSVEFYEHLGFANFYTESEHLKHPIFYMKKIMK